MTSRPAAPESETPETDKLKIPSEALLLLGQAGVPEKIVQAMLTLGDHARSLERRLSLAQTEIKGHMRVEEELKAQVARLIKERDLYAEFAGNNVVMQARIAELEKLLRDVIDANPRYNATAELGNRIDAALKDRA